MVRRALTVFTIAAFAACTAGVPLAVHLHVWHAQHGEDSHHDNAQCPVCHVLANARQAELDAGPAITTQVDLSHWERGPAACAAPGIEAFQPIAPRAPPAA